MYFVGKCLESNIVCQETDVSEAISVCVEKAPELLSFEETRRILKEADYQMMYENWARYEEVCRYFSFNPIADIDVYKGD